MKEGRTQRKDGAGDFENPEAHRLTDPYLQSMMVDEQ